MVYQPGAGYVLLGGEHRLAALRGRGQREATVYVLHNWRDWVAWMMHDRDQRERFSQAPWNYTDAAYLTRKAVELLKPAREEKPYDDVAEFTGTHEGAMANVRWLIGVLDNPAERVEVRDWATRELRLIARAEAGPHGVRDRLRKFRAQLDAAAKPPMPAAKQRDLIGGALATMKGVLNGLDSVGSLNPDLTPVEVAAWLADLSQLQGKIMKLRTTIKEQRS